MTPNPVSSPVVSPPADSAGRLRAAEDRLFAKLGLQANERWLDLPRPAGRTRVLEVGEGPPVLHVHGGGGFGALHAPLAAALPGRRHLLLDRPGFGLSERLDVHPDFRGRSVHLLVSTLDACGLDRVDVVGNSVGGGMALWLALAHPERVRSVALVGGAAMIPGPDLPFLLRLLALPGVGPAVIALDGPSPSQVRSVFQRFGHDPDTIDPAMQAVTLAAEQVPAYSRAWAEVLQATITWRGQRPGLVLEPDELRRILCPVALAWGSADPMVPADAGQAAAGAMPDATFALAGTGHLPWLDDADGVARIAERVLAAPIDNADLSNPAKQAPSSPTRALRGQHHAVATSGSSAPRSNRWQARR